MPYADLHVHTTRSDGQLALEDVPAAATEASVPVVGLTDHDRLQPLSSPVVERDGVTIVHGIELRVESGDGTRVDLLGYGVERTADLERTVERVQRNRRERGRAIVDCVEDRLGIDLDVDVEDGFGRPHVARAIADHPDAEYGYQGAFDRLIGFGEPCYVPREVPSFERGRQVLAEACAVVSLAHPLRYRDPADALELAAELDAVELHYPYGRAVDRDPVERAIDRHGLAVTGGSDAHDDRLGLAGLSRAEYRALELPAPVR
ncbi:PHP domain-containing protein [Natrialbaceae archaeon AArc-T1-2]|uniref:PHP domain-containing protein n=1 Tax=Natrialbaceae archaeon AArc-T1-2 TaxID=3053904 RepID=UPI00255AA65F|nr:PHP domain-containing protein [Natrialbaceae archaeon AArc-T1-2]WIV66690.1 PHP domain-containing protein [Natrialbaceae archaeon AArc-T1-2]